MTLADLIARTEAALDADDIETSTPHDEIVADNMMALAARELLPELRAELKRREREHVQYNLFERCIAALQAVSANDVYAWQFARDVLRECGITPEDSK